MTTPSIVLIFSALSVLTLFGALGTILSKNPIHSVIYLILTFFSISAHYILLNAQFLAAVNIIVYAGAIMVLFLFVIMFLNLREGGSNELNKKSTLAAAGIVGVTLGAILIGALRNAPKEEVNPMYYNSQSGIIENLGQLLYKDYLLPFELVSILFLAAMVGAVMLGKREAGERNF
ncbi:MAG: NADH-quinone oxidoreductase subunit J [Spirosomataceae bacterium]